MPYIRAMPQYSVIIPVYNRPDELAELLESLARQTFTDFDVTVVEDGSTLDARAVVERFMPSMRLQYFQKPNSGPGPSRNHGAQQSLGQYLVFFDSDCILPHDYFEKVNQSLREDFTDAYGGPDMAHPDFSPLQKAINHAMTSFLTTGGIRGGKVNLDTYHPRSFNMGISNRAFLKAGGFSEMRFGEDLDLSLRLLEDGFRAKLIPEAAVFHKRRTDLRKFFKQVHNSGIARLHLFRRHPHSLKALHLLPSVFTLGLAVLLALSLFHWLFLLPLAAFALLVFLDAWRLSGQARVALLAVPASFAQLVGYGTGFLRGVWNVLLRGRDDFQAFRRNFYQ